MLTSIKGPESPLEPAESGLELLLGCHDRIRHFTSIAHKLATVAGAPARDVADAAAAVLRYYTIALPLHEADENESLYPRLKPLLKGELASANQAMVDQHKGINESVRALVPLWEQLRDHPERHAALQGELRGYTAELQRRWDEHLRLEEKIILPAAREHLKPEDVAAIDKEMKARRA